MPPEERVVQSTTRPSVHATDSLPSRSPYLEQVEQAISTPVLDLASTLTTPESRPLTNRDRSARPTHETWHDPIPRLNPQGDASMSGERITGSDLAESLDRMQSELDRWQTERDRLRAFLGNQQNRQLALEEQNLRLRRQHSRLAEENSRLFSTATNTSSTHLPRDILDTGSDDNDLANLATAIAEVGRENYSTRGGTPHRQRLYDWAAPSRAPEGPTGNMSQDEQDARHRDLDYAFRSYHAARDAIRAERSANDMGTVPTASALRQYWTEEERSADSERTRMVHEWADRHRRERQQRLQAQLLDPAPNADSPAIPRSRKSSLTDAHALKDRIRNTIRYLSKLRRAGPEDALHLARLMDLDVLYECEVTNTPNDLPLLIESLPSSEPSSWLRPGTTWHGLQCTAREHRPPPSMLSPTLRMIRQREYFGRSTTRRGIADAQNAAAASLRNAENGDSEHIDPDRYLSSLMRDTDGRWGFGGIRQHAETKKAETEHWPVTVAFHTVDRERMVVTGTMRASQIPDRASNGGKSMESYFEGEIIDFRQHSLETDSSRGYKVGGLDTDARYWSRIGPFKEAIEKQARNSFWDSSTYQDKLKTNNAGYWEMLKTEEQTHRELEADRVMMRCIGNQRWLRETLGTEWILMRWKEKCFVEPILKQPSKYTSGESSPNALTPDTANPTWGLTISGFYYIALHRQSGMIDGLYYDPGSQPYQSLRMAPEDMELPSSTDDDKQLASKAPPVAIKKWFPAVEFR